ncbi:hypothetical protein JXR93_03505 [bacterium]|nr:hypothetical protein [bacterium]
MRNIIFSLILALFMFGCVDDYYELQILYVPAPDAEEECKYKLEKDSVQYYFSDGLMDVDLYYGYNLKLLIETTLPSKKVNEIETNDVVLDRAVVETYYLKRGRKIRFPKGDGVFYLNSVIPVNSLWLVSVPLFKDTEVIDALSDLNPEGNEALYDPNFRVIVNVKLEGTTKAGASVESNSFEFSIYTCNSCFNLNLYPSTYCGTGTKIAYYCRLPQDVLPVCEDVEE